jgi:hypothetical protein
MVLIHGFSTGGSPYPDKAQGDPSNSRLVQIMDISTKLMLTLLFSSIGIGYFVYGKKQGKVVPLISGGMLCAYPYFVTTTLLFIVTGVVLTVIPYLFRE